MQRQRSTDSVDQTQTGPSADGQGEGGAADHHRTSDAGGDGGGHGASDDRHPDEASASSAAAADDESGGQGDGDLQAGAAAAPAPSTSSNEADPEPGDVVTVVGLTKHPSLNGVRACATASCLRKRIAARLCRMIITHCAQARLIMTMACCTPMRHPHRPVPHDNEVGGLMKCVFVQPLRGAL
jgi:hypothetical protein